MNPHFIFNALGSIKGLIVNGQNQEAAIYISKFSKLVRRVLENSINKVISLKEELEVLDMNICLEQLRFRDGFDYILNINTTLDTDSLSIPPVLLQPFVENAIWHGFKNNPKQNILTLSLSSNNGDLTINIQDSGVGIEQKPTAHKSRGIEITRQRIYHFSQDNNEKRLTIEPIFDEQKQPLGTMVTITLPLKHQSYAKPT